MSTKDRIKNEVETIVTKGHQVEQKVISFIKNDYANTLNDLKVDVKIESELTLEYLEGVEEALLSAGYEGGKLISQVAETLLEEYKEFVENFGESTEAKSKELVNHSLEKVSNWLQDLADKIKSRG